MRQQFTTDERGVSEVIGAILVFGLVIALIAMLQMYAVPAANEDVEANHNQGVQSDLIKFEETSSRTAAQGTTESTRIRMGTSYPNRFVFFNPPSPAGTIRTSGTETGSIDNIRATDNNIEKYIGSANNDRIADIEVKRLEYSPRYNEYQNAPTTVLEYGALYNDYGNGNYGIENNGTLLSGNTINLRFYGGSLSRTSSNALSLEAHPTSAPTRTVTVEPTDDNVTLVLPSRLPADEWNEILGEEQNFEEAVPVGGDDNLVEFRLNGSVSRYELKMAQIGVGNNVPSNEGAYIVPTGGQSTTEIGARSTTLPFEVRDQYNNPVSGETVNISVSQGEFRDGDTVTTTTDERGQPVLKYTADNAGIVEVNASIASKPWDPESGNFNPGADPEDLSFEFVVDPSLDNDGPTADIDVSELTYSMCTNFNAFGDLPVIGDVIDLLGCVGTTPFYQIQADYDIEEVGGSGLDHIEIRALDEDENAILVTTHQIEGTESVGMFHSPQINLDEVDGVDAADDIEVEVIVYDEAGNEAIPDDI